MIRRIGDSYRDGKYGRSPRHEKPTPSRFASILGIWDKLAVNAGRALILGSLTYVVWRFGGTDSEGIFHLACILTAACVFTLTAKRTYSRKLRRLPVTFFTMAGLWIVYAVLQGTHVSSSIPFFFSSPTSIHAKFGDEAISRLQAATHGLEEHTADKSSAKPTVKQAYDGDTRADVSESTKRDGPNTRAVQPSLFTGTVIVNDTRQAVVPFVFALALAVLSAILFDSRKSRRTLLWFVIANASMLAAWGIIQRAGGNAQILPGIENTFPGTPFASFIYKNAGAAVLLPGLGAVAALIYGHRGSWTDAMQQSKEGYGGNSSILGTRTMALIALGCLIMAGLFATLSRGAWLAAAVAFVACLLASRVRMGKKEVALLVVSGCLLIGTVIYVTGIQETIARRADQVNVEILGRDQRWDHWADGLKAAVFYLPSGGGLGTYGYASLPNQTGPRSFWFRKAHNQYLEILVESGVIGLALTVCVIIWFATCVWRLLRQDHHREKSGWGLLGFVLLICGTVQNAIDFVLIIPAVLMLYGCLVGVVGATERSYWDFLKTRNKHERYSGVKGKDPIKKSEQQYAIYRMPVSWCAGVLLLLIWCVSLTHGQLVGRQALTQSLKSTLIDQPTPELISQRIAILDSAIDTQPLRSELYRRRAYWQFADYRLQIIEAAMYSGQHVSWESTQPESLCIIIATQSGSARESLLAELHRTPEMREALRKMISDLSISVRLNPLHPLTHMTCLFMAPLVDMPVQPWIESVSKLNQNDESMLYFNGLIAFHHGHKESAIDQWSRSLAVSHRHLDQIFELAQSKFTTTEIATHLIPSNRTDLFSRMLQDAESKSPEAGVAVAEDVIAFLDSATTIEPDRKAATLAGVYKVLDDSEQEVRQWAKAVENHTRNAQYRWHYADALRRNGQYERALEQAVLGSTMHRDQQRFEWLTLRIRQDIRRQRDFD